MLYEISKDMLCVIVGLHYFGGGQNVGGGDLVIMGIMIV